MEFRELVPKVGVDGCVGALAGGLEVMGLRTVGVLTAENDVILIGGSDFEAVDDKALRSREFLLDATPGLATTGALPELEVVLAVVDRALVGVVVVDEGFEADVDGFEDVCLPNMVVQCVEPVDREGWTERERTKERKEWEGVVFLYLYLDIKGGK